MAILSLRVFLAQLVADHCDLITSRPSDSNYLLYEKNRWHTNETISAVVKRRVESLQTVDDDDVE